MNKCKDCKYYKPIEEYPKYVFEYPTGGMGHGTNCKLLWEATDNHIEWEEGGRDEGGVIYFPPDFGCINFKPNKK